MSHTTAPAPAQPFDLDDFRAAGERLVARMSEYLASVEDRPVSTPRHPDEIAADFAGHLPRDGRPAEAVWEDVWSRIVPDAIHLAHPMYLGHQVAPPLPHAVWADALASLLNQSLAVWEMSPTATLVEAQVIEWMKTLVPWPDDADGTLVSGGSVANLTGLLAARESAFPGAWEEGVTGEAARAAVFAGAASHYSIERTLGVMGLGAGALVAVPERGHRMDPGALASAIAAARAEGLEPMAIVATAGSTATGHFDDLEAIADVAEAEDVWLHVDGAHGASFLASERLRGRLRGIERADSIAWDPHKMMLMPISGSAVLVRDGRRLDAAFDQSAPYLFHPRPGESRSRDTGQRTLQCSRRFDALKLWVAFQHYGLDRIARLQERTVDNARTLYRLLDEAHDFEPLHEPQANILCFRWLPPGLDRGSEPDRDAGRDATRLDAIQTALRERYNASGQGWITATVLDGHRALRVTLMNPRTTDAHLEALLEGLREVGKGL